MKLNQKEIESVVKLGAPKRYEYFIKRVADWEEAWGLYNDGWALARTNEGEQVFLLWPAKEYAELCATGDWVGYKATSIPISEVINELTPNLKKDRVLTGIFYTPENNGITPEWDRFIDDLNKECVQYE
jgi:hypothetical protein